MSSGRGEWISSTRSSHWHASSTSAWWPWSSNPTASAVWRELWRYKSGKTKARLSKGGILFCMMHYILLQNAQFVRLHVCFVLQAAYLCFLSLCCCYLFLWAVILYALIFTLVSLSLLTQLRALAAHGCDVILLALARCLSGSAWAPALARCTHARFFLPSAQSRKAQLLPETRFVKATPQISLIVSHFVTNILTPHTKIDSYLAMHTIQRPFS